MTVPFEKATGVDASWLHMENDESPLHVASCPIFQMPEGKDADTFFAEVKELIAERAVHLKNYRIKKIETPFSIDHPVWHDSVANIDIDYHVRRTRLPAPGTIEQLELACARIAAAPMDMNRPLWEYHIIEGLEDNRIGVFIKVHHAVIDGQLGVMQLDLMMDPTPEPRRIDPPEDLPKTRAEPDSWALLSDAFVRFIRQPFDMMEALPRVAEAATNFTSLAFDRLNQGENLARTAPPTPFNRSISRTRRVAMASVPMSDVKAIKNALGVTLNDTVMAICGGALRTYLERKDAASDEELLAMVPVSLRQESQGDHVGNLVTGMVSGLATHIADPIERAKAIHENTVASKAEVEATKGAQIQNYNIAGAPVALRLASQAYAALKLADLMQPMFNVTISNVAGPRHAIYLNGAEMLHYHPVSLVVQGQGLNITVQSYRDSLDFGMISCRELLPDLAELRDDLLASFEELKAAALGDDAGPCKPPTDVAVLVERRAKKASARKSATTRRPIPETDARAA
ncbi:MAG: WS/DGAT/MGAT family O-acyltransferase [Alphaproteobacteria bacterium]